MNGLVLEIGFKKLSEIVFNEIIYPDKIFTLILENH